MSNSIGLTLTPNPLCRRRAPTQRGGVAPRDGALPARRLRVACGGWNYTVRVRGSLGTVYYATQRGVFVDRWIDRQRYIDMCVCVYCMYVFFYFFMSIYMYIYIYIRRRRRPRAFLPPSAGRYVHMNIYMCVNVYVYIHACISNAEAGITRSESEEASGLSTTQHREVCSHEQIDM